MGTSYRTAWTEWNVIASGMTASNWSSPAYSEKSGPEIKLHGYSNSSWANFNTNLSNLVNNSISQIASDHSTFIPSASPSKPVAASQGLQTNFSVVGAPSQQSYGFATLTEDDSNVSQVTWLTQQVDSGDCAFTGTFNPQLSGISYSPIEDYEVVSTSTGYVQVTASPKALCEFSLPSYSLQPDFYPSLSPAVSALSFELGWQHSIDKEVTTYNMYVKSPEETESIECI